MSVFLNRTSTVYNPMYYVTNVYDHRCSQNDNFVCLKAMPHEWLVGELDLTVKPPGFKSYLDNVCIEINN